MTLFAPFILHMLSTFTLQSVVEGTIGCAYVLGAMAGIGLKSVSKIYKTLIYVGLIQIILYTLKIF